MEKLRDSLNFCIQNKLTVFIVGLTIPTIFIIKNWVYFELKYPSYLYLFLLFFIIFLFNFKQNSNKFHFSYLKFVVLGFIFLLPLTLFNGLDLIHIRLKPIILIILFSSFFMTILIKEKNLDLFIFGFLTGAIINCIIAYLQKSGFTILLDLRELIAVEKYKSNDWLDKNYWQKHPPGLLITSIQFNYILCIANVLTVYFFLYKKFFLKFNSLIFGSYLAVLMSYSFLTLSKITLITNLIILIFVIIYKFKNKVNLNKPVILISFCLIFIVSLNFFQINLNKNLLNDRILLLKQSYFFFKENPMGVPIDDIQKKKIEVVSKYFKDSQAEEISYLLTTSPHNFIITSSFYNGVFVLIYQILFVIILVFYGYGKIFKNQQSIFLRFLFFAIINNLFYGMFHNSGIYNGDPFILLFITLLIVLLSYKKNA